jgi:hypothetical protein
MGAFKGHDCSTHRCRFSTSSCHTAKSFHDRRTCDRWKDLDNKHSNGSKTKRALEKHFNRRLHQHR